MDSETLEKALVYLKETQEFVVDQAPEIIVQILKYEKISTSVCLFLSIISSIILLGISIYCILYPKVDKYGHIEILYVFGSWIPLVLLIPMFSTILSFVDRLLKIYISPKYFLIDLLIYKIK